MTTRSFALTSLVAAIPGAAVVVLIVFGILAASGEIFGSIPLAITAVIALLCGVAAAALPVVLFMKKAATPAAAAPVDEAGAVGGSSGELEALDGDTGEVAVLNTDEFEEAGSEEFAEAESAEFVEAESAEFESPADEDPFADFDADEDDEDSFFEPSKK